MVGCSLFVQHWRKRTNCMILKSHNFHIYTAGHGLLSNFSIFFYKFSFMCILTGPENCYRKEKILSAIVKYSRQIIETFSDSGREPGTETCLSAWGLKARQHDLLTQWHPLILLLWKRFVNTTIGKQQLGDTAMDIQIYK